MKKFIIILLIASLVLANTACSLLSEASDFLDAFSIDEKGDSETVDDIEVATISTEDVAVYKQILKIYQDATIVDVDGEGTGNLTVDLLGTRSRILSTENFGAGARARDCYYAYFDIDDDGTHELLISDENRDTGFVDIYTISADREAIPVFFGDFAGRAGNINNASLLKAENGTYIALETGGPVSYSIFLYYISENCTKVDFSDSIWVNVNDGNDPDTADRKGELMYYNGSKEITKDEFEVLEKAYTGDAVLYDWMPVQFIRGYVSPLNDIQLPDKLIPPTPHSTTETVNVRIKPDAESRVVYGTPWTDVVYVIGEANNNSEWVFVRSVSDNNYYRYGWARSEFLVEINAED